MTFAFLLLFLCQYAVAASGVEIDMGTVGTATNDNVEQPLMQQTEAPSSLGKEEREREIQTVWAKLIPRQMKLFLCFVFVGVLCYFVIQAGLFTSAATTVVGEIDFEKGPISEILDGAKDALSGVKNVTSAVNNVMDLERGPVSDVLVDTKDTIGSVMNLTNAVNNVLDLAKGRVPEILDGANDAIKSVKDVANDLKEVKLGIMKTIDTINSTAVEVGKFFKLLNAQTPTLLTSANKSLVEVPEAVNGLLKKVGSDIGDMKNFIKVVITAFAEGSLFGR